MIRHSEIDEVNLRKLIRQKTILFGGNTKLKISGLLQCNSGKRMKKESRVFFISEKEAVENGYRPYGHCMKGSYKIWKDGLV
ncbi:MAG: metal-binding protein [Ferruginibacter sp.]